MGDSSGALSGCDEKDSGIPEPFEVKDDDW